MPPGLKDLSGSVFWKWLIVSEMIKKDAEKTGTLMKDVVVDEDVTNHAKMKPMDAPGGVHRK